MVGQIQARANRPAKDSASREIGWKAAVPFRQFGFARNSLENAIGYAQIPVLKFEGIDLTRRRLDYRMQVVDIVRTRITLLNNATNVNG